MQQGLPFFIGKWMKSNIWKAISDAYGDNKIKRIVAINRVM